MTEKRLQYELVLWFSQKYPELRGHLFEINNDTYNVKHAMTRRAMGMISGVSDLIFVVPKSGKTAAIELKAPSSVHSKEHIQNQVDWGVKMIKSGGYYLITSDLATAKDFIEFLITDFIIAVKDRQGECIHFVKKQYYKKTVKFL